MGASFNIHPGNSKVSNQKGIIIIPFSNRCEAERGSVTGAGSNSQEIMESTVVVSVSSSHPISLYLPTICFQTPPLTMLLVLFLAILIKTRSSLAHPFLYKRHHSRAVFYMLQLQKISSHFLNRQQTEIENVTVLHSTITTGKWCH